MRLTLPIPTALNSSGSPAYCQDPSKHQEIAMERITKYRGFEIHVDLVSTSEDMFDAWFSISGPLRPPGVAAIGERIKLHGGPFSRRWAPLIAELAGRAAIDVILGVE
jgi:hypothetical protein